MQRDKRVAAEREHRGHPDTRGQRLAPGPGVGQRLVGQAAQGLLGEVVGRRIDGREVRGLRSLADVVGGHLEPETVRLPAQAEAGPGRQLGLEPRLVEPRRADLPCLVRDVGGQDVEPTAPSTRYATDDDLEHRLVLAEQRCHGALLGRRLVAPRPMGEQVADRRDPQPCELAPHRRADPGERVDAQLERLG